MTQQATEPQASRMLAVEEALTQLGIGRSKFYELIRQGRLKATDLNHVEGQYAAPGRPGKRRCLRVSQAEINRYLCEGEVRA
jgi:hypothetical protein